MLEKTHSGGDLVCGVGQVLVDASIPGVALQAQVNTVSQNLGASRARPPWNKVRKIKHTDHQTAKESHHHCIVCLAVAVLCVVHAGLESCQELLHCNHNSSFGAVSVPQLLRSRKMD